MDVPNGTPAAEPAVPSSAPAPSPEPAATPAPTDGQNLPTADPANPAPAPQVVEPELYDLPDGRKVDAKTLAEEWKSNFMPDYTQKSQTLAQIQKQFGGNNQVPNNSNNPSQAPAPQAPAWQDPNWVPQTYAEIVEAAAQKMQLDQQAQVQKQQQAVQQANQYVDAQLAEIRKTEPNLSEELLLQHAYKYGFGDLKSAFQNMKDFNLAVQKTAQQTAKNIQQRAADPVGGKPGTPSPNEGVDYRQMSQNNGMSAVEFLRKMQGK